MDLSISSFTTAIQTATNFFSFQNLFLGFLWGQAFLFGGDDYHYPINYLDTGLDNACATSALKPILGIGPPQIAFDFIVVGAGNAGSVIASRLSENCSYSVLIIEAGTDPDSPLVTAQSIPPLFFHFTINGTKVWNNHAEPSTAYCQAFRNGCPIPTGKQLGGTTESNAMLQACGTDRDYNNWAEAGNPGWDYNSVLPYFKKSEDNTDPAIVQNGTYHGTGGLLTVSTNFAYDPFITNIKDAFNALNYKTLNDINAQTYNGFVPLQSTIRDGERCSAYRAFLSPVKNRTNIKFMKNSLVDKVIFSGNTAIGVNVKTSTSSCSICGICPNIFIKANKEVILSAGAFGSPKILLQSGIGKSADLMPGVAQKKNLPVGDNFQDHARETIWLKINPNGTSQTLQSLFTDAISYYANRTGNFAVLSTDHAQAFLNTIDVNATYPDVKVKLYRSQRNQQDLRTALENFDFNDSVIAQLLAVNADWDIVALYVTCLNPKSRGTVKLKSSNPNVAPKIIPKYFSDPDGSDVATILRGIDVVMRLMNTTAMQAVQADYVRFPIPECDNAAAFLTPAYWTCHLKYFGTSIWDPSGTCKMGPNSTDAVVDARLRVYGITGLRVADASIMPAIVSGGLQCATYMIGEKCADMIKQDWQ